MDIKRAERVTNTSRMLFDVLKQWWQYHEHRNPICLKNILETFRNHAPRFAFYGAIIFGETHRSSPGEAPHSEADGFLSQRQLHSGNGNSAWSWDSQMTQMYQGSSLWYLVTPTCFINLGLSSASWKVWRCCSWEGVAWRLSGWQGRQQVMNLAAWFHWSSCFVRMFQLFVWFAMWENLKALKLAGSQR